MGKGTFALGMAVAGLSAWRYLTGKKATSQPTTDRKAETEEHVREEVKV